MQQSGITADITRHLSSLRMNTNRRNTSSSISSIPIPHQAIDLNTSISDESSIDTFINNQFDPMDPDSYPPDLISPGIDMIRVTRRKRIRRLFKLSLPSLILTWNSKSKSKIEFDKIQSIRVGNDAKNYREEFNVSSEFNDLWITVIYITSSKISNSSSLCNDLKALHMIAPTKRNFDIIFDTLTILSKWSKEQESLIGCANIHEFSKIKWNNKIKKLDREFLSFDDIIKLTFELHIFMDNKYLLNYFNQCDKTKRGSLNFQEFQNFVFKLRFRPELLNIFKELNINNGKMYLQDFIKFIKDIQHENSLNNESILEIFNKFSHNNNQKYLTISDFSYYLHSTYSIPLINEEMLNENYYSYPLTDYFISSSHNTYLLGKQIHGFSSIEGYIHALQRGCRCIEIDIWDGFISGSKEQNPIVTHGHTLTNSIDFKLVIDIIRKYAFITTPYPLIISLEIKCSLESQLKCINIMKLTFGDMLIDKPINNESILPSPKDLKHKILIKVKKSKMTTIIEPIGSSNNIHSSFSTSSTQSGDDINLTVSGSSNDDMNIDTNSKVLKNIVSKSNSKNEILPELTLLAPYFVGIKFRNFSLPESKTFNHVFSFSDRTLISLLKDSNKLISILKHNKRGLMRIYPSVVRFRSDNFNPIIFWELGCQMVATNWQIWDSGEEIGESLFKSISSEIGYSGYRLKPKSLRKIENINDKEKIKTENLKSLNFNKEHFFDISIISGQQLPKPKELGIVNSNGYTPWVEIEVFNVKPIHAEIVHLHQYDNSNTIDSETDNIEENLKDEQNNFIENNDNNSNEYNEYKEIDNINEQHDMNSGIHSSNIRAGSVKLYHIEPFSGNQNCAVFFKTRLAENDNDAFSPRWNASCRLKYLSNKNDLTFIRFLVKTTRSAKPKTGVIGKVGNAVVKNNNNDYTIGSWCCKIGDLMQGYRQIRLGDNKGEELIYSSLFIKVTKN